jgi:X-Pro dipeptidyl-peptidase
VCAAALMTAGPAHADAGAPDAGVPFVPRPASKPLYGVSAHPIETTIPARDGTDLHIATWLPTPRAGASPPAHVPTVLVITPYAQDPQIGSVYNQTYPQIFVPRGYAVSVADMRGFGESGGCADLWGPLDASDAGRIVRYVGERARWSDGSVGMVGTSADAASEWLAALSAPPRETRSLKAIVPVSGTADIYDVSHDDGVADVVHAALDQGNYSTFEPLITTQPSELAARACAPLPAFGPTFDPSGDFTKWYARRDDRRHLQRLRAAVLLAHGFHDQAVPPRVLLGLWDRIPSAVPHKAVVGQWGHGNPGTETARPSWQRADWFDMVVGWMDRWVKGLHDGARAWPPVQVQDATGQWRAENSLVGMRRAGRLYLGSGGTMGAARPQGQTSFIADTADGALHNVSFETPPLPGDLRIYGNPVLDTWLRTTAPNASVGVRLDAISPNGHREGFPFPTPIGARSLSHLAPFRDGRFVQARGRSAPTGRPLHLEIRLPPTDLLVPRGWRLRLTLWSIDAEGVSPGDPLPQEMLAPPTRPGTIDVLHDCSHPTSLRFALPARRPELLNVREPDEAGKPLAEEPPAHPFGRSGGGMAFARPCG